MAERVTSRSRLQKSGGSNGLFQINSSHCDSKTLTAIDLAFDEAWNVLETRASLHASRMILS
jgi:hypothetical protein